MKSFHKDGGEQTHLRGNAILKYHVIVPSEVENRKRNFFKYHLSCRIVNVHSETTPLSLIIKNGIKEQRIVIVMI